jgi:hypothetical protein
MEIYGAFLISRFMGFGGTLKSGGIIGLLLILIFSLASSVQSQSRDNYGYMSIKNSSTVRSASFIRSLNVPLFTDLLL